MTELTFKGKEFVYNHHLSVPFRPLMPHADKGIGAVDLDGNLIIQGDNLHALKALLPRYAGKVDCIFIDPPYNTGNEGWAYNDNVNAPMIKEWLAANPIGIEDGLRHDKWCAMMWPRLRLLHELLSEDGTFCVCIGDDEIHRLRDMLDIIFGDQNFIACFVWQSRAKPSNIGTAKVAPQNDSEYILMYSKDKEHSGFALMSSGEERSYPHNDKDGKYRLQTILKSDRGENKRETMRFRIDSYQPPIGERWQGGEKLINELFATNRAEFREGTPFRKYYEHEEEAESSPFYCFVQRQISGTAEQGKVLLNEILGNHHDFDTVKPLGILNYLLARVTRDDSVILDSFSGSGTTAHAILETNKRDGGNRKFILVETEDYADKLTAERVRRVINGYEFSGTQKTELLRERLNYRALQNAGDIVQKVNAIENLHGQEYDRITKQVKDAELIVTGERAVAERTEGLGGNFTYCTLGEPIELDAILTGKNLPAYEALGSVLYHMATNRTLDAKAIRQDDFHLGEHGNQHVWLIYKPELEWLKGAEAALTLSFARKIAKDYPDKDHLVFAASRFVSEKLLGEEGLRVEFVPLPFALYRIEKV